MTTYQVRFEVEIPDDAPLDDVEAFMAFELGARGSMKADNALAHRDLESFKVNNVLVDAA